MRTICAQQDANDIDVLRQRVIAMVCENWTEDASHVASDAIRDMLDMEFDVRELLDPVFKHSDYWLEQIARACFSLPSDDSDGDWPALLEQIGGPARRESRSPGRTRTGDNALYP